MKISHFMIDRPVFAVVISVLIVLLGGVAYFNLGAAQYPQIVPPTVNVTLTYPGASAETIAETVADPIEQQINGVEDMIYMSSQSTGDGNLQITVTFKLGVDLDKAQELVQDRVTTALPRLPQEVQQTGITVRKSSPDILMAVHMYSPDGSLDQQYVANYVTLQIQDHCCACRAWATSPSGRPGTTPSASGSIRTRPPPVT
jgi:HAE1 family hydrophobic/amphiphilic exporter-1